MSKYFLRIIIWIFNKSDSNKSFKNNVTKKLFIYKLYVCVYVRVYMCVLTGFIIR